MQIKQELINRFFINECSSDEVDLVVKYFSENKDAFEKNMGKAEWDNIDIEACLNSEQSKMLLASLKKQLFYKRNAGLFAINGIPFKAIVAAASVILLIVSGWWFTGRSNAPNNTAAIKREKQFVGNIEDRRDWQVVKNTGEKKLVINLEDGSVITLFKNSVVQYPKPFSGNVRSIELNGDAFFEVVKNKLKPFTVYAGNLSTTALGTSFRITAFDEGKATVNVKLLTGKVVVKAIRAMAHWKEDRFLLPGDLLTYNAQTAAVLVSRFVPGNESIANISRTPQKKQVAMELKFNNTALNEVMNAIAALHHIKISYSDTDIKGMNFTGIINEYDDVQAILKMILHMNELQVNQTPEGFNITSLQKR